MGENKQIGNFLPRMIVREKAESGSIPPLPKLPDEFKYGGEWMDPQWKKDARSAKKLFTGYPIHMAIILVVTIGLAIGLASLSSTVCSGSGTSSETGSSCSCAGSETTDDFLFDDETPSGDTAQEDSLRGTAVSGNVGTIAVTIEGFKLAEDMNGVASIMVQYKVTNNGAESTYFYYLDHKAFQNGVQLTNSFGRTDEYDNQEQILEIQPGGTHTVHCLYNLSSDSAPVEIRVSDMLQLSSDVVTTTFDLGAESAPAATEAPTTTTTTAPPAPAIVSEGTTGDYYIKFVDSSIVTDDWGDPYVCATFDFTNNSSDATSAWSALTYGATQDGEELNEGTSYFNDEYTAFLADVQPGETVRLSIMFYGFDENGGEALVSICDYWDEETVISYSCPVK